MAFKQSGNYVVSVIDGANKNAPTSPNYSIAGNTEFSQEVASKDMSAKAIKGYTLNIANKVVNNTLSNVKTYNGNSQMQNKINNAMKVKDMVGGIALGFAVNPVLGGFQAISTLIDITQQQNLARNQIQLDKINSDYEKSFTSFSNNGKRGKGRS